MTMHALTRPSLLALTTSSMLVASGCVGFITEDGGDDVGDTGSTGEETATTTDGPEAGTTTEGGDDTSIYDVQGGVVPADTTVTVKGVVVTSPVFIDADSGGGTVFVEEPGAGQYSGISLYLWSEVAAGVNLAPGDVVDLTGEYKEFFDVSQLVVKNLTDITVVSSGAALPGPDVVAAADVARTNFDGAEPWEGVRVQILDAVIAEANDGFGQYLLQGDALVGNIFVDPLPTVLVGGSFDSVTGSLHYSFGEFKLEPTMVSDLAGYMDPPEPMVDTAIYDIQQGMVAEGSPVKIEGVIASSGLTWTDASDANFFMQEPAGGAYSGIQVYVQDITGLNIAAGDDITVVGTYDEFFDMSQIVVSDASKITINNSGPAPAPEVIADPASIATNGAMAEQYEGVLVRVEGVTVIDENPDAPSEFGEFAVTGNLRVDDMFFAIADWMKPAMGADFASITGPLVYAYSNFKLEPRDAGDLVAN